MDGQTNRTGESTKACIYHEPARKTDAELIAEYGRTAELAIRLSKADSLDLEAAFQDVEDVCERVRGGELSSKAASEELFEDDSAAADILSIVDGGQ